MIRRLLKAIHNVFYGLGINISFVKKESSISALRHNSIEEMNSFFADPDKVKSYIDKERIEFYRMILNLFSEKGISVNGKTVADFGCGTGHLLLELKNSFKPSAIHGFDFTESAVAIAKDLIQDGHFERWDIYNLYPKKFDILICTEVLEHLLDPGKALRNLIQTAEEGGVVFLTVPDGRKDTYEGHINFWSPESWDVFLNQNSAEFKVATGRLGSTDLFGIIYKSK